MFSSWFWLLSDICTNQADLDVRESRIFVMIICDYFLLFIQEVDALMQSSYPKLLENAMPLYDTKEKMIQNIQNEDHKRSENQKKHRRKC